MNWFHNMSISKKIQFGFISVISFSVIIGVYSTFSTLSMSKETQKMYDNPYTSVKSILTIKNDITKIHSLMQEVATTKSLENIERISKEIESFENNVFYEFKVFGKSYDGNMDDFQKLKLLFIDSKPIRSEIVNLSLAGMDSIATDITNHAGIESVNQLNEVIDLLLTHSQQSVEEFVQAAKKSSSFILSINVVVLLLLLIVSLVISSITTRSIVGPVTKIKQAALNVSKGELNTTLTQFHQDEIGLLAQSISETTYILNSYISEISSILSNMARGNMVVTVDGDYKGDFLPIKNALNEIADSLNGTLQSINIAAESVADSATTLNNQALKLSESVVKQAIDTQQLTEFIKNISIQSKENQANADNANSFILQIKKDAEKGTEKMHKMLIAMNEITTSSQDIDKIVKVIENIAFQTTILSLNASIEAAAAGVHGQGFAIVAQQVRELADKSSNAATQTRDLVTNSMLKSNQGSHVANETSVELENIITGVNSAVSLIDNIFKASTEQSVLVENVVTIVENINDAVVNSEQSAQQSAYESKLLTDQAILLKDKIDQFKLKEQSKSLDYYDTEVKDEYEKV